MDCKRILKAGFTLTEMLTVVLIVGIMTTVALPQYRRLIQRSRVTEAVGMLRVLSDSAERLSTSFGYRTVGGFASSARDGSKFVFERLDMVGTDTVRSCAFAGTTMTCENFTYTLNSDGTIDAAQTATGVTLTVHPDVDTSADGYITCAEGAATTFCDLYGYETPATTPAP